MKRLALILAALVLVHVALLFVPARAKEALRANEKPTLRVGVVFDVGGRGDKSFNDGAWNGAERAAKDLGAEIRFVEPGDGSDREAGLRMLAAEGMDLVIGVGFIFTDDLLALAKEYPDVHFAGVDFALRVDDAGNPLPLPENLAALKFREEEGSYLVGALAALAGGSKKIGFVGGMDIPLIHKFEQGYRQGVAAVCKECEVIAEYAGATPEAFRNPSKGKELALAQYQSGVRVIFHASGSTGLGVFEAARDQRTLAIGVDADQYDEAPGFILTSMTKGVDTSVYESIRKVLEGSFEGGVYSFGLAEDGVGYVYDDHNRALIPDEARARVEALRADIVEGRVKVEVGR